MTTLENGRPAPFFIGEHLAMDFLNTTAAPLGEQIEWLGDGADLVDWLERAGAIDGRLAAKFRAENDALPALAAIAKQARHLREWWRRFVERHAGKRLGEVASGDLAPLNRLLARDDGYRQIEALTMRPSDDAQEPTPALRWRRERRWKSPDQLLQPRAEAIGDLVCHADFHFIRQCEAAGCTLMFYDRSKSHARRWCSMAACGNRAKAATHRARHRRPREAPPRPRSGQFESN